VFGRHGGSIGGGGEEGDDWDSAAFWNSFIVGDS
jgi:hypothetical protein